MHSASDPLLLQTSQGRSLRPLLVVEFPVLLPSVVVLTLDEDAGGGDTLVSAIALRLLRYRFFQHSLSSSFVARHATTPPGST